MRVDAPSAAFSREGTPVVSGFLNKRVQCRNEETRHAPTVHSKRVTAVAFSSDGTCVASGSRDKPVRIWNVGTGCRACVEGPFN